MSRVGVGRTGLGAQGGEFNHYPGPFPVADVQRRLFGWQAESRPLAAEVPATLETMDHFDNHGQPARWSRIEPLS